MILKSERIAAHLADSESGDRLEITPKPDIDALRKSGAASVDLRLGTWFMALRPARIPSLEVVEGRREDAELTKMHYVPFGAKHYLHPRNFVLGVTLEWIRLPRALAGYVVGKSSWGRRGLIIATAVGVHPGFAGCLTLELSNVGEIPVALSPGLTICQLFLHKVDSDSDHVDASPFVGQRRPTLGHVTVDDVARRLAAPSSTAQVPGTKT
jgi:dCTP deaminase